MFSHFRSKKHDIASMLVPWLEPFLPAFYTEEGNYHRQTMIRVFGKAFLFFVTFVITRVTMQFYQ